MTIVRKRSWANRPVRVTVEKTEAGRYVASVALGNFIVAQSSNGSDAHATSRAAVAELRQLWHDVIADNGAVKRLERAERILGVVGTYLRHAGLRPDILRDINAYVGDVPAPVGERDPKNRTLFLNGVSYPAEIAKGALRFKENAIIWFLLEEATAGRKCDLNRLWIKFHDKLDDMMELYRLIGYSASGYGDVFCDKVAGYVCTDEDGQVY